MLIRVLLPQRGLLRIHARMCCNSCILHVCGIGGGRVNLSAVLAVEWAGGGIADTAGAGWLTISNGRASEREGACSRAGTDSCTTGPIIAVSKGLTIQSVSF